MKKSRLSILGINLLVAAMAGCGDSGSSLSGPVGTSAAPTGSVVSGQVRRFDGGPAGGFLVTLQNRTTNEEVTVAVGNDGAYSASVQPGVYDARLDDSDSIDPDEQQNDDEANMVFGPIVVSGDKVQNFQVDKDERVDPGRVSGRILTVGDQPAALRRIVLQPISAVSHNPNVPALAPMDIETTTDAQGNFQVSLGGSQAVGFNLRVYGPDGTEDEFIDVFKPSGVLSIRLAVDETEIKNVWGVTEGPAPVVAEEVKVAPPTSVEGIRAAAYFVDTQRRNFRIRIVKDGLFSTEARLEYGNVPAVLRTVRRDLADLYHFTSITNLNDASGYKSLYSLLTEPVEYSIKDGSFADSSFRNSYPGFQVSTSSKTLVWAYQIEVLSDSPVAYRFFDHPGDSYYLRVLRSGYHNIDYNSNGDAGINTVEISTGIF